MRGVAHCDALPPARLALVLAARLGARSRAGVALDVAGEGQFPAADRSTQLRQHDRWVYLKR